MPDTLARPQLMLVDAYSLIFRAYFGGRAFTTSDGRPTGALYGFTNMLFNLLANHKPDAMIVCWDAPEQTLREKEFEAYKAHRPKTDDNLVKQFPMARVIVEAFGLQSAEVGGYEADDLIGTLATRGVQQGYEVTILTGDSDQLQLVGPGVTVQMTQRGVTDLKPYDADAVRARYGVGPEHIPDWKALVGDTSDNIPGVPKVGEKTATTLLQKWGTLENLLEHTAEVTPPGIRATLETNMEKARFSKWLATIVCDVPADLPIRPYAPNAADYDNLRAVFADLEFKSLLARLPASETGQTAETSAPEGAPFQPNITNIDSAEALHELLDAAARADSVALIPDFEGGRPLDAEMRGVGVAFTAQQAYYVPIASTGGAVSGGLFDEEPNDSFQAKPADLKTLFAGGNAKRCGSGVKALEISLMRRGIEVGPFDFDAQIAAYLLNSGRAAYPLSDMAETYLGVVPTTSEAESPADAVARDAALVIALRGPMRERIEANGMTRVLDEVEMPLIPALAAVETVGLLVDAPYLGALSHRMAGQLEALASQIYELAGESFNIGSPKQMQAILFDKLQLEHGKKTKTGYSTGADVLEALAPKHDIAARIIEWREISKLKVTYADALGRLLDPNTGRVHTTLNQTVTSTGRLSSSDPNLQNIPVRSEVGREIRRAFIAPPGKTLLSCDYSQIELRVLAHVTKDPTLVKAFEENEDIHAATASVVFEVPLAEVTRDQRRRAKTINFAVIYGQSGFSLATTLGVETGVANTWIKEYFARLPGVERYVAETKALAHEQKWVSTLLGRRRYVQELDSGNPAMRQGAERAAVNMPIQGTAADIMKLAMTAVYRDLKHECPAGCTLLLQVHDELLFEVEDALLAEVTPRMQRLMERAYPLDVPLRVDAKWGPNWAEMHS